MEVYESFLYMQLKEFYVFSWFYLRVGKEFYGDLVYRNQILINYSVRGGDASSSLSRKKEILSPLISMGYFPPPFLFRQEHFRSDLKDSPVLLRSSNTTWGGIFQVQRGSSTVWNWLRQIVEFIFMRSVPLQLCFFQSLSAY